jgi:hypothetical protein
MLTLNGAALKKIPNLAFHHLFVLPQGEGETVPALDEIQALP